MSTEHRGTIITRVLDWLRAGYPQGVPTGDYVALLGLLHRRLTTTEVEQIATTLVAESGAEVDEERIRAAIRQAVLEEPLEDDINRVRARLAAGGWPLASPEEVLPATETDGTEPEGASGTGPEKGAESP